MQSAPFDHAPGRRALFACGLRLGAFALAASVAPRLAGAEDKLAKSAVQYDEATRTPGRDCDDCTQFVPDPIGAARGTCRIVAGDISPHGHCVAFTPKQKG